MTGQPNRPRPTTPPVSVVAELRVPKRAADEPPAAGPSDTGPSDAGPEPEPAPVPVSRVVTKAQVAALLAAAPERDQEISRETISDAYVLDGDQCLLVFSDRSGRLYESRAHLVAAMRANKPGPAPRSKQ